MPLPGSILCGLLNSQPMGFYSARSLIDDARRHGVSVRPVDIQHSHFDNTMNPTVREAGPSAGISSDSWNQARPPHASRTHVRTDTSPASHHCRRAELDRGDLGAAGDGPCAAWQTTDDRPSGPCKGCMISPCFEDFSDPILSTP